MKIKFLFYFVLRMKHSNGINSVVSHDYGKCEVCGDNLIDNYQKHDSSGKTKIGNFSLKRWVK